MTRAPLYMWVNSIPLRSQFWPVHYLDKVNHHNSSHQDQWWDDRPPGHNNSIPSQLCTELSVNLIKFTLNQLGSYVVKWKKNSWNESQAVLKEICVEIVLKGAILLFFLCRFTNLPNKCPPISLFQQKYIWAIARRFHKTRFFALHSCFE